MAALRKSPRTAVGCAGRSGAEVRLTLRLALVFILLGLAGCADLSPQVRWQQA